MKRTYDDDYFLKGGAGYPGYIREAELLVRHGRGYAGLIKTFVERPGSVLDVGAAAGFILKGFVDSGWKGKGVEPNPKMAEYARQVTGVDVTTVAIEEFHTEESFDLVSVIQVIAHFVDPSAALAVISRLVSPRGFVLIETWSYRSWVAKLFGRRWHEYSPPTVLHWFSLDSLQKAMAMFSFERVAAGRAKKQISLGHARSVIGHKIGSGALGYLIARCLGAFSEDLCLPYPSWDLFWSVYRRI